MSSPRPPRIAARAVIVHEGRLLLVNAFAGNRSPLMCAPGGGVEAHSSLPENLAREVHEETGLRVTVGAPCLVNEFHDRNRDFHQVEVFFRCTLEGSADTPDSWKDPEAVVTRRRWVTRAELADVPHKPSSLGAVAFDDGAISYDPLEPLVL
ncbi:NUDIX domain-containing protein [Sulfitobacter sp. 20_GPM-1509m]|uniref:NUDIX domain-containing protein n=1 Tax=Sulfitobacter sp. 20_GPM-1509m TaxID=1380367 RepID=UPI00048E4149|nr:NUDIX domain-containing protein [Sulfitobacter sp. 20_GPM-1509m]